LFDYSKLIVGTNEGNKMKNLLMTCLFILTILLAWTKTTYASYELTTVIVELDSEYSIEDKIEDCEDEVKIQHENEVEYHELINMMLECREELGQR